MFAKTLAAAQLKPRFVANNSGDLFVEISIGGKTLQRAIPSLETLAEAEEYVNKAVVDMAKEFYRRKRNRAKRGLL